MQITSLSSSSFQPVGDTQASSKMKQSFDKLGSALESGDLSSAKDVLAQMKKNAPAQGGGDNPMSKKMDALSKAVESGDVKGAQQAYADIKKTMAQTPGGGGAMAGSQGAARGGQRPGGTPPAGGQNPSGASGSSASSSSASSSKTYDAEDTNKDGKVSAMEEIEYSLTHPEQSQESSTSGSIDVTA
jgi:hypothetical protein